MRRRHALLLPLLILATPATAGAATITVQDFPSLGWREVKLYGTSAADQVSLAGTPASLQLTASTPITLSGPAPNPNCSGYGTATVTCSTPTGSDLHVDVSLGGGDDAFTSTTTDFEDTRTQPLAANDRDTVVVAGDDGDDTITGSDISETLDGGAGADVVSGRGGIDNVTGGTTADGQVDRVDGGAGDDFAGGNGAAQVAGGAGDDLLAQLVATSSGSIDGGAGEDTFIAYGTYGGPSANLPVTVRLDAAAPTTGNGFGAKALTLAGIETAFGGPGDDTLSGGAGPQRLIGAGGSDTLDGGAGPDTLLGGFPSDTVGTLFAGVSAQPDAANALLAAGDGATDVVRCALTTDKATADVSDDVAGCTSPTLVPAPVTPPVTTIVDRFLPPADTKKPALAKVAVGALKGKALRKSGRITVRFTPSEAVTVAATATAKARRVASIAAAGDLSLATRSVKAAAGKATTTRLTVSRKLRKLLKKGRRVTVALVATDAAGNATTVRRAVRVRG